VIGAFSAPLAVGIPITAQGLADRVVLITGDSEAKSQDSTPEFDPAATVIWLQETDSLHGLARALIREGGYPTNWPVAVVERSGQPGRRAVRAPLHAIAAVVAQAGLEAPVAIVMGSVVRRAEASGFELDADGAVEVAVA